MASPAFEQFIQESLINSGVVSGALLLSRHGHVLYKYGDLLHISKADHSQFLPLFDAVSELNPDSVHHQDLCVTSNLGHETTYKVYQKTFNSMYATCSKGSGGLTVCNLPYGILVCTYSGHTRAGDAVKAIEKFCDIMRR
ncbi:uncharacterized protein LOC123531390 [Mercenaria mercenaria]|uniref:uncharacterized protein LOC123531390 n=1 Tax=Mercenaria mercenaria TaxID=6596 RepID=UPI001E1DA507|nr:uncharacterized protein LOC123531390 [Mercenaria mercenaria]